MATASTTFQATNFGRHRVPLIIVDPEIDSFVSDALVESVDVIRLSRLQEFPIPRGWCGPDTSDGGTRPELKMPYFSSIRDAHRTSTRGMIRPAASNSQGTAMGYSVRTQDWRHSMVALGRQQSERRL